MAERRGAVALALDQVAYQNRVFRRTPISAFFAIGFPVILLVVFELVFSGTVEVGGTELTTAEFFTPGLAVFAAVSATYTNLAVTVPIVRDEGILKRVRGTPLPSWAYLAGHVGNAILVAVVGVALMLAIGILAFGVELRAEAVPAMLVSLLVGVAAFASLGMAIAAVTPSGSAAPAVANATILPLALVSNVFIPLEDPPRWLDVLASALPLKPFVESFSTAFAPEATGSGFEWLDLAVVAAWGVAGAFAALRWFRWEPRTGAAPRRSRRRVEP